MSKKSVVVLGGGYAGLSSAIRLAQNERLTVHLVDQAPFFLNTIRLHKTIMLDLDALRVDHASLARKHGYEFHQSAIDLDRGLLRKWADDSSLPLESGERLDFDFLVLALGGRSIPIMRDETPGFVTLEHIKQRGAQLVLEEMLSSGPNDADPARFVFVGAGATALQFVFELEPRIRAHNANAEIILVDIADQLLPGTPRPFHDYAVRMLKRSRIDYRPGTRFLGGDLSAVKLQQGDQPSYTLSAKGVFLFPGVHAHPFAIQTNVYGQLLLNEKTHENIYAAGDCARFDGPGTNAQTAQAAVRKGRRVATNIERAVEGKAPQRYTFKELGYFVSLGPWDGMGWLLVDFNVLTGVAAFAVKEAIELQVGLFLEGVDTYIEFL